MKIMTIWANFLFSRILSFVLTSAEYKQKGFIWWQKVLRDETPFQVVSHHQMITCLKQKQTKEHLNDKK